MRRILLIRLWVTLLLVLEGLGIGMWQPGPRYSISEFLFGWLIGNTTLAAAWAALGPGPIGLRILLSLLWVALLPMSIAVHIAIFHRPSFEFPVIIGACLVEHWLVVQLLVWPLVIAYDVHVRHRDEWEGIEGYRKLQFSVGSLMVVTAIFAVILGAARVVMGWLDELSGRNDGRPTFFFLALVAALLNVPVLVAALSPRRAILLTLPVLVLIGLATAWEVQLLAEVRGNPRPDLSTGQFAIINASTVGTVLAGVVLVRLNGFGISGPQRVTE
jgi:hypothetical protein